MGQNACKFGEMWPASRFKIQNFKLYFKLNIEIFKNMAGLVNDQHGNMLAVVLSFVSSFFFLVCGCRQGFSWSRTLTDPSVRK